MRRGGRRRQWITTADAAVSCPDGRWGRRRTRVTECWAVLRAEDVYTSMLRGPEPVAAGSHGNLTWAPGGRSFTADFEIRENRLWRHGRVFLRCSRCSRLATRLYLPTDTAWLACRQCWGLTYPSRTHNNYRDGGGGLLACLGASHRIMAQMQTESERDRRREASIERWAERRDIVRRKARAAKRRQATQVPHSPHV